MLEKKILTLCLYTFSNPLLVSPPVNQTSCYESIFYISSIKITLPVLLPKPILLPQFYLNFWLSVSFIYSIIVCCVCVLLSMQNLLSNCSKGEDVVIGEGLYLHQLLTCHRTSPITMMREPHCCELGLSQYKNFKLSTDTPYSIPFSKCGVEKREENIKKLFFF